MQPIVERCGWAVERVRDQLRSEAPAVFEKVHGALEGAKYAAAVQACIDDERASAGTTECLLKSTSMATASACFASEDAGAWLRPVWPPKEKP